MSLYIDLIVLSVILISAELVMKEKIDYNDLVATVEDEKTSSSDDGNKLLVGGNKEGPKAGKFLKIARVTVITKFACELCKD